MNLLRNLHPERRQWVILACVFFWSVLSYVFFSRFVLKATEVEGVSMEPTLRSGDRLLLIRLAYRNRPPARGDIVAIQLPDEDELIVKRIVAKPGERVQIEDGRVRVNGGVLPEVYLPRGMITGPGIMTTNTYVVGRDCYFVLGDNRVRSLDSRYFGAVNAGLIVGRVVGMRQAFWDAFGL